MYLAHLEGQSEFWAWSFYTLFESRHSICFPLFALYHHRHYPCKPTNLLHVHFSSLVRMPKYNYSFIGIDNRATYDISNINHFCVPNWWPLTQHSSLVDTRWCIFIFIHVGSLQTLEFHSRWPLCFGAPVWRHQSNEHHRSMQSTLLQITVAPGTDKRISVFKLYKTVDHIQRFIYLMKLLVSVE